MIYKFWYNSKILTFWTWSVYLLAYILLLKDKSIYFTYIMIFLTGILIGYIFADKAHKFLNRH
jgi:hypothetical protein